MLNKMLSQDEIETRLIEARLAWRSGDHLIGERALLGVNGPGSYLVYPMSDDPAEATRLKQQIDQLFADAANVAVQAPIGRPTPQ
jgi:hypothetical protein